MWNWVDIRGKALNRIHSVFLPLWGMETTNLPGQVTDTGEVKMKLTISQGWIKFHLISNLWSRPITISILGQCLKITQWYVSLRTLFFFFFWSSLSNDVAFNDKPNAPRRRKNICCPLAKSLLTVATLLGIVRTMGRGDIQVLLKLKHQQDLRTCKK